MVAPLEGSEGIPIRKDSFGHLSGGFGPEELPS
jgi:hypothetical protein